MRPVKSTKKKRSKKSPDAPKQPLTSYLEFAKIERAAILNDGGNLSLTDVGKELGRRWKNLPASEKAPFEEKSRANREQYAQALHEYNLKAQDKEKEVSDEVECTAGGSEIKVDDIGFAKEKGYSWHPALRSSTFLDGSRIVVTFFGSGQRITIDRNAWLQYSDNSLSRVMKSKAAKMPAFHVALKELTELRNRLLLGENVSSATASLSPPLSSRRYRTLNKDQLQKERDENNKKMEQKMYYDEKDKRWKCKSCPWKGRFKHKAKGHARSCGGRRKVRKTGKEKKFLCSRDDCQFNCSSKAKLDDHYR